ncbi:MAG TPA: hypothetical protein VHN80_07015, partial [Kineosporiaceae bacterium]|nr:hypothetical protein [Kineosporiaceae bacterium]
MLVWGAWREALDRALTAHRTAAGVHAGLSNDLHSSTADLQRQMDADRRLRAAAAVATSAAGSLPGGWLGAGWTELAAITPKLGDQHGSDAALVRIGAADPLAGLGLDTRIGPD